MTYKTIMAAANVIFEQRRTQAYVPQGMAKALRIEDYLRRQAAQYR